MNKRVLHIVGKMNLGGTESFLMNIYENIDRSKIQFDFLTYYEKNENGYFDKKITSLGGKIYSLNFLPSKNPIKAFLELKRIIKKNKYKIIHAHTTYNSGYAVLASFMLGVEKIIVHSHNTGTGKTNVGHLFYKKIMLFIINKFSTDMCACSQAAAKHMFYNQKQVRFIPNTINFSKYETRNQSKKIKLSSELKLDIEEKIIGHIGRFGKAKNHEFIIKIFSEVLKVDNTFRLVLIGSGESINKIKNTAKKLNVYQYIRFLGVRKDIPDLMSLFDLFILPSNYEGFGIVLLEAQASGLHCLVSENIQPEVDMGLDLMHWVPLEDEQQWIKNIRLFSKTRINNSKTISSATINSNHTIEKVLKIFHMLYGVD